MPHPVITPPDARLMAKILDRPDFDRWAARARTTGGCSQPIFLKGTVDHVHTRTGEVLHRYTTDREPDGVLPVACKTRRASRCPACSQVYRADTYQLIRAGLAGGKGVPVSVTEHPAAFVTLTAPSFGTVHARRERPGGLVERCHPRRKATPCSHGVVVSCTARHSADDSRLGQPLCADCYDYTGSVLFNALAPELWRRFTMALRRYLAKSAGLTQKAMRDELTLSFAKVAEYQRRGVVHFHAVIRFDGPDGPDGPTGNPPGWATPALLDSAVRHSATAVTATSPAAPNVSARTLTWGAQVDVKPITTSGALTDQAVAGYIAKYATKAAECVGTLDRRLRPTDDLAELPVTGHARRLISECLRLGQVEELAELKLFHWAHMLGFRGHFSTKSRRYSTTLGALRQARIDFIREQHPGWQPADPDDTDQIITLAQWRFDSQGLTRGEALVTAALTGRPIPALVASDGSTG